MQLSPFHQTARLVPQKAAVINEGIEVSYEELSQHIVATSEQLTASGLKSGDKLGCVAQNSIELIILYWACVDSGILFCPLSPKFPEPQLQQLIQRFSIDAVWVKDSSRFENWLNETVLHIDFHQKSTRPPLPINYNNPANIILTSGSSGQPKAAVHCLRNHLANALGSQRLIQLSFDDGWFLSLPLFHIGGLAILNRCALAGAAVVMPDQSLTMVEQLKRDLITHLSLVPTQLHRLLADGDIDLSKIKSLLLGGGAVSQSLLTQLQQLNITAFTSYGMTEMGSQITTGIARSDGSSGKLLTHRELTLRDGVIWVKGDTLFLGYLQENGNIDIDLDNGWFCTKDRGYWDDQGLLHVQGRVDNMFICGGENIQPEEIEQELKRHSQIIEAIVFAEPNEEFGLLPSAIIKTVNDIVLSESELTQFLLEKIARFKRPRRYYSWPNIVTNSLKIQRKQVIAAIRPDLA